MGWDYGELVSSPYDDEPPRRPIWLVWVGGLVAVVAIGAVVWFLTRPDGTSEAVVAAETTTTVVASTSSTSTTVRPGFQRVLVQGSGPEPSFDTSTLGVPQVFGPVDNDDRRWNDVGFDFLSRESKTLAPGEIPDTSYTLVRREGTIVDPLFPSYGGPGACFSLRYAQGGSDDCFAVSSPPVPRPLFSGLVGTGVVAWGLLPSEASVAVLTVNGEDVLWQQPVYGSVAFRFDVTPGDDVELRVLDADGAVIETVDRSLQPRTAGRFVDRPITGYGDYSDLVYDDVPIREVNALVVTCMGDNGHEAALGEESRFGLLSIDLSAVRTNDKVEAKDVLARCLAGLNVPDPPYQPSTEELQEAYEFLTHLQQCLSGAGFDIPQAPPFDEWSTQPGDTRWEPFLLLELRYPDTKQWEATYNDCAS